MSETKGAARAEGCRRLEQPEKAGNRFSPYPPGGPTLPTHESPNLQTKHDKPVVEASL